MADKIIVLAKMEMKSWALFDGGKWKEAEMAAFVGATDEKLAQFGIGVMDPEGHCRFWALAMPHLLVTSWRGMQVLDRLGKIQDGTIHHAYYVGKRREDSDLGQAISELEEQLPEVAKLRDELLKTTIPDEELDRMLKICNSPDNGIDVAVWELQDEIKADVIHETAQVKRAFEIDAADRAELAEATARSKQALPRHQSFRAFCEDAKIRYLCNAPIGAYGWDWDHYDMTTLDEKIVYAGLRFKSAEPFACTENPGNAEMLGHVGFPVILLKDGRELTLKTAHYHDNQMWAGVCPVKSENELTEWKLDELAAMEPRMVGIAYGEQDKPSLADAERGYALVSTGGLPKWVSSLLQKLRK